MTDPDPATDADARSGSGDADAQSGPRDADSTASTDSETTATTEPMSEPQPDADDRDRSPNDAAPDPDALFEDERDPGDREPDKIDRESPADGIVSAADGPIAKLYWAGLATAVAFGAFALYRFYASVTTAIDVWVTPEYEPLLQASFNFAVLLGAAIATSLLVRRLSGGRA